MAGRRAGVCRHRPAVSTGSEVAESIDMRTFPGMGTGKTLLPAAAFSRSARGANAVRRFLGAKFDPNKFTISMHSWPGDRAWRQE